MRRLVDAVADQAQRDDRLRPGLYAADLLQRLLTSPDPDEASGDWLALPRRRPRSQRRSHAGARAI